MRDLRGSERILRCSIFLSRGNFLELYCESVIFCTLPWANRLRELHAAVGEVCGPEIGDLGPGGVSGFHPSRTLYVT